MKGMALVHNHMVGRMCFLPVVVSYIQVQGFHLESHFIVQFGSRE
jgi:hypothetical protein